MKHTDARQESAHKRPIRRSLIKVALSVVVVLALASATTYAIKNHSTPVVTKTHIVEQTKPATKTQSSDTRLD
jgi:anti-sigma-K factor RskA